MKWNVFAGLIFICIQSLAQVDSTVSPSPKVNKNSHQHFGLFAGAGYSLLQVKAAAQVQLDSGDVVPAISAQNAVNLSAGFFYSIAIGRMEVRPSVAGTFSPTQIIYDFNRPVNETFDVFPMTADAALHLSGRSLKPSTDTISHSHWSPVFGINAGFPIKIFNGKYPAMPSSRVSIEGGVALKIGRKVRDNLYQRRSIELIASFNLNKLNKDDDELHSATVESMRKHSITLRFYFQ